MKLSKEFIAKCAKDVLAFLDSKRIEALEDIAKIPYIIHHIGNRTQIIVQKTPSGEFDSTAQSISYVPPGEIGTPLDIKINGQQRYSAIIFKGDFSLPGYEIFTQDAFGNNVHYKKIKSVKIADVRSELEKLTVVNED